MAKKALDFFRLQLYFGRMGNGKEILLIKIGLFDEPWSHANKEVVFDFDIVCLEGELNFVDVYVRQNSGDYKKTIQSHFK